MRYLVNVKVVHVVPVCIEADSKEEAVFLVEHGEGEDKEEYLEGTLDSSFWGVQILM